MIYPLVPLYLASVLMAGPRALGLIKGVAEATASLLKLFSGAIIDRTRRAKPWVVAGYALAGFSRLLIAFATSWPGVLALRFADRVGRGLRTSPRDALLAGSVDPSVRGLAFGLHRAMDNAGAVVGPLLAALLLDLGWRLTDVFLFAIMPALACLILALMLREPKPDGERPKPPAFSWRLVGLPPAFKRYLVVLALFGLFAFYGVFMAATEGVGRALVADLAPPALRGTAFGWFNLTAGLILLPASLLFGALYQGAGALTAFAFSAACALTAALLLPFWVLRGASRISGGAP